MRKNIIHYLKAYNILQLLGWIAALVFSIFDFEVFITTIFFLQVIALIEILHAYKKWNNASVLLTSLQLLARIYILILIYSILLSNLFNPIHEYFETILITLLVVWCIAEIIRYSYYIIILYHKKISVIIWLRYNAFIILYPIGVFLEFYIIYMAYKLNSFLPVKIFLVISIIVYIIYFPKLYRHLLQQRKKTLSKI
jgi:very-long-chain (3R)-3-hydroxyacyl-CoA dehydratase